MTLMSAVFSRVSLSPFYHSLVLATSTLLQTVTDVWNAARAQYVPSDAELSLLNPSNS